MSASIEASLRLEIASYQAALAKAKGEATKFREHMKQQGSGIGDSLLGGVGKIVAGGAIIALGKQALNTVVDLDRLERGMTTLEGSSAAASIRLEQLREDARLPGLDFEQAVKGDIRLRAVGISADLSRRAMIEMGNALSLAGGTAADLDGVLLALTQIASKGKVSAEEINQIAERVPQVRAVMKDIFGTADTEVLQKMNIEANVFIEKLVGGFGQLSRAKGGLDEDLTDIASSIKMIIAEGAGPIVKELIPTFRAMATSVAENKAKFRELGEEIGRVGELFGYLVKVSEMKPGEFFKEVMGTNHAGPIRTLNTTRVDDSAAKYEAAKQAAIDATRGNAVAGAGGAVAGGKGGNLFDDVLKAQQKLDEQSRRLAEDQMTREQRIADLRQRIAQEIPVDPFGADSAAAINAETTKVELQRELNNLIEDEASARQKLADKAKDEANDAAKKRDNILENRRALEDELTIANARNAGDDKQLAKLERELAIKRTAAQIERDTGLTKEQARKAAETLVGPAADRMRADGRRTIRSDRDGSTKATRAANAFRAANEGPSNFARLQAGESDFDALQRKTPILQRAGLGAQQAQNAQRQDAGPPATVQFTAKEMEIFVSMKDSLLALLN